MSEAPYSGHEFGERASMQAAACQTTSGNCTGGDTEKRTSFVAMGWWFERRREA